MSAPDIDFIEIPSAAKRMQRVTAMVFDISLALCVGGILAPLVRLSGFSDASLVSAILQLAGFTLMPGFLIITMVKKASPGKMILGLRICAPDGSDLPAWRLFVREGVAKLAGLFVLGPLWIFLNTEQRAAWDYISGSLVVPERRFSRPPDDEKLETIP